MRRFCGILPLHGAAQKTTGYSPVVFHIFPYYHKILFSKEARDIQRFFLHGALDVVGLLDTDRLKPCLRLSLSALSGSRLFQSQICCGKRAKACARSYRALSLQGGGGYVSALKAEACALSARLLLNACSDNGDITGAVSYTHLTLPTKLEV